MGWTLEQTQFKFKHTAGSVGRETRYAKTPRCQKATGECAPTPLLFASVEMQISKPKQINHRPRRPNGKKDRLGRKHLREAWNQPAPWRASRCQRCDAVSFNITCVYAGYWLCERCAAFHSGLIKRHAKINAARTKRTIGPDDSPSKGRLER